MAKPKVADPTASQFKDLMDDAVSESLEESLTDPDEGLVLRGDVAEKLRQSIEEVESRGKTIPLSESLTDFEFSPHGARRSIP